MITMRTLQLFILLLLFLQVSCQTKKKETVFTPERSDSIVILRPDYPESSDTVKLSQIADTVFYVKLQHKLEGIMQIQYLDSLIFIQTLYYVAAFNQLGELLYKTPVEFGCFDLCPEESRFYTYTYKTKQIKAYDFKGQQLKQIRFDTDCFGASFLAINDSLFAFAPPNDGYNKNELIFVNGKGRRIGYKKIVEPFVPTKDAVLFNETWPRTLFKSSEGFRFHRCYGDTLFSIEQDMTLHPILIEQKIPKVPLEKRMEYAGGDMIEYLTYCAENKKYAVRVYENSRYYIAEYLEGKSHSNLPNYLVYDKMDSKLNIVEIDLSRSLETHHLHLGIFNDYDGGLAFTPLCQTGDYLIMENAGEAQGDWKYFPRTLYDKGKWIIDRQYSCRSDVYRSIDDKKRVDTFFDNFNEKKNTMLMIVKLKKLIHKQR